MMPHEILAMLQQVQIQRIELRGRVYEYVDLAPFPELLEAFKAWRQGIGITLIPGLPGMPAEDFLAWQEGLERQARRERDDA